MINIRNLATYRHSPTRSQILPPSRQGLENLTGLIARQRMLFVQTLGPASMTSWGVCPSNLPKFCLNLIARSL